MNFVLPRFEFFGTEDEPFLAPRGVFIIKNKLFVCDTAQNRICIWNDYSKIKSKFQNPDLVLGINENKISASLLKYPSAVWSDGNIIIVADSWHHRVLIWNNFPTKNFQPADIVLGQKNFSENQPNIKGLNASPIATSLYWCYGLTVYKNQLFIADTGNRRIIYYKNIPNNNTQIPDAVIGQKDFFSRDTDSYNASWPYSVKISSKGLVAIADTQSYRILIWKNISTFINNNKADIIIGQKDFLQNGQNQYNFLPNKNTLNWVYDMEFYKEGIIVADSGNSRLLYYPVIPKENNANAEGIFGQKDFNICGENLNIFKPDLNSLYWPFHISIYENKISIADTGSQRIIIGEII